MPRIYYGWIMLSAVALMTFASSGSRFSFGVFVQPMSETFGWDRAQLALAASLNLLVGGLFRPVAGILADRAGSKLVALVGVALAASALILTSYVRELWQFYFAYGLLLAIGYACASPVTVTTLVSHWFVKRRSLAMSIGSTGTSLGELVTVPLAMLAVLYTGWDAAFRTIAGFMVLIVVPAVFLLIHNRPADRGLKPYGQDERLGASGHAASGPSLTLRQAARSGDFWRLSFGFFVCGFTMSFASTHFVPFAMDMGFEPMAAANALGLVGGFSIVGGLGAGYLADRFSRKNVLAAVYLGMMFTIMPIGSAVGAYLGGVVYERAHSYELSLTASAIPGLAAALVVHGVRGPQPEIQSSRSDLRAASELVGQTWQSPKKGTPSPA